MVQQVWGSYHRHPRPSPDSVALGGFQKGDPEPDPSSEATATRQDNVENGWVLHGKMGGNSWYDDLLEMGSNSWHDDL